MTAGSAAPARPDARPGAARSPRRWLPTALVLVVIVATVLGGFLVAEALPIPEARPVAVGGVVTVRPLPGWEVARAEDVTLPTSTGAIEGAFVQITRGSGALDLLALPQVGGTAEASAVLYADHVLASQLTRLSVSDRLEPVTLRSGLGGVRFGYIGTEPGGGASIEGSVTVVVSPGGHGVVFDGWGFEGQLQLIAEELATMIEAAEVA